MAKKASAGNVAHKCTRVKTLHIPSDIRVLQAHGKIIANHMGNELRSMHRHARGRSFAKA